MSDSEAKPCMWLSFVNETGFAGVAVVYAANVAEAAKKCWDLGINPGGQVLSQQIDPATIKPEHFDRLLKKEELREAGYIE